MTGIVVINKEKDFTSHDVVAVVKRTLKLKAGHTGTLDPQAAGVLPVCVGTSTKLAGYLSADDKVYTAKVRLGITTDTGDDTGKVLTSTDAVNFSREQITGAVASFAGEQLQTPPMYSAVKVNGKKLYELARKGKTVEREPRRIFINSIKVLDFFPEERSFTVDVACSKGTYIRSLCMDIGEKLGCGACMSDLVRTRSGIFTLENSVKLRELSEKNILRPEEVLPYPKAIAQLDAKKFVLNGNPVPAEMILFQKPGKIYWLYWGGTLRGLYRLNESSLIPEVML